MTDPITAIEQADVLDPLAEKVVGLLSKVMPQGPVKDLLTGGWQGHPVHPPLTDVPIGCWLGSLALDLIGGERSQRAADLLLGLGIVSAVPTVAAGVADWVDSYGDERRVGFVHAAGNLMAIALYSGSYVARKSNNRTGGLLLSMAGTAAMTAAGFLGGHLVYRLGNGVDHTRFAHLPEDWTPVLPAADLPDRVAVAADAGDAKVLLYKEGDRICALADTCSHRGGPLHEGQIDTAANTVTCPWHSSVFDLCTGEVKGGPASAPQPRFDTRVSGDQVEVRVSPV